jgi:hypothetical protein
MVQSFQSGSKGGSEGVSEGSGDWPLDCDDDDSCAWVLKYFIKENGRDAVATAAKPHLVMAV